MVSSLLFMTVLTVLQSCPSAAQTHKVLNKISALIVKSKRSHYTFLVILVLNNDMFSGINILNNVSRPDMHRSSCTLLYHIQLIYMLITNESININLMEIK